MNFSSPIHIISDRFLDADTVTPQVLRQWRKEILLRFNFAADTVIEVNGREFDKQTVTDSFKELENDFPFHLKLFKNKPLLAFLEAGDLAFTTDKRVQRDLADDDFRAKIYPLFVKKYSAFFTAAVVNPTDENLRGIEALEASDLRVNADTVPQAFAEAYGEAERFNREFAETAEKSLPAFRANRLGADIPEYVNPQRQRLMQILPAAFLDLKREYARTLHNKLLVSALSDGRANMLHVFKKSDLRTLLTAAEVAKDVLKLPQADEIINIIKAAYAGQQYRKPGTKGQNTTYRPRTQLSEKSGSSTGHIVGIVVMVILFVFRLVSTADKCARDNNRNAYHYNNGRLKYQDDEVLRDIIRRIEERERLQRQTQDNPEGFRDGSIEEAPEPVPERNTPPPPVPPPTQSASEAPPAAPQPRIVEKKVFTQKDLFGSWVTHRTAETGQKIKYKYNIINPTQGARIITLRASDNEILYSVSQPFTYSLSSEKWEKGRLRLQMKKYRPIDCTPVQADSLLRLAERNIGLAEGKFEQPMNFDYQVFANRTKGIRLDDEYYRPSADIEDLGLFANAERKNSFLVGYVNNLLQSNGVSIGRDPIQLRWYADKEAEYWMARRKKENFQIARIVMSNKKLYFKPVHFTPADSEVLPVFWLRNVYFIDADGRKKQGDMRITYHRKGNYFSIKTEPQ